MEAEKTLYHWLGGAPALDALTRRFYFLVLQDPLLKPVFERMPPDHPQHVALFLAEVMGGPAAYSELRGHEAHGFMMRRHLQRHLTEAQRHRWVELLLNAADEVGIPADAEFRSAFLAYLEWGTHIAVQISQADGPVADPGPMPLWSWKGLVRG